MLCDLLSATRTWTSPSSLSTSCSRITPSIPGAPSDERLYASCTQVLRGETCTAVARKHACERAQARACVRACASMYAAHAGVFARERVRESVSAAAVGECF